MPFKLVRRVRLMWVAVVSASSVPIAYSVGRLGDQAFLDALMSSWLATVVGIAVGVPIAVELSRRQFAAEEAARQESQREELAKQVRQVLIHVSLELSENERRLDRLQEVLSNATSARADLWRVVTTIIGTLSSAGFDLLRNTPEMFKWIEGHEMIYTAYQAIGNLSAKIHESAALFDFHLGYSGNQPAANRDINEAREGTVAVRIVLQEAIRNADEVIARLDPNFAQPDASSGQPAPPSAR